MPVPICSESTHAFCILKKKENSAISCLNTISSLLAVSFLVFSKGTSRGYYHCHQQHHYCHSDDDKSDSENCHYHDHYCDNDNNNDDEDVDAYY